MTEWEAWLADGTTRNSRDNAWEDAWDGVLVVRYWGAPTGKGMTWGDGLYGKPGTYKQAAMVSNEAFAHALAEAQATTLPPSKRSQ